MSETQGLDRDTLYAAVERSARLEEELAATFGEVRAAMDMTLAV